MNKMKISLFLVLLLLTADTVVAPALAIQSEPPRKPGCAAAEIPGFELVVAMMAPSPPQGDVQGCCVIKSGAQNQWKYIYTTSQNCTQMARSANVSYSFYPNTDCSNVKPK